MININDKWYVHVECRNECNAGKLGVVDQQLIYVG